MLDENTGQLVARWAIRIAVACYVLRVGVELRGRKFELWIAPIWTVGFCFFLVHLFFVFDAFHDWSHSAAVEFTAEETQRIVGIRRGEGVWVNYVFAVVWLLDCGRLWVGRSREGPRKRGVDLAVHTFFAVMMFSATVVFGPAVYLGLAPLVACFWFVCWKSRLSFGNDELN